MRNLGFVIAPSNNGGATVTVPDPFGLFTENPNWEPTNQTWPWETAANAPAPVPPSGGLMDVLRRNKTAVYAGAAAIFLLAILGGKRR